MDLGHKCDKTFDILVLIMAFQMNVFVVLFYHNSFEGIFNLLNAGVGKVLALLFHKHMPVLIVCRHRACPGFYVYAEDSMALRKQTNKK